MSLINIQSDQNVNQIATQLAQIIQSASDPVKVNFIRNLADQLGISSVIQNEDNEDEGGNDYKEEHDLVIYNDGHDDIKQRGKLVFIDDCFWEEDFARNVFDDDPNEYCACDFEDVENLRYIHINNAIDNVNNVIETLTAVKNTLEQCKNNDGKYVIWNNDEDFDYETGDPKNI